MTTPAPLVTDHALLRWLERVEGLDLDALRARIAAHAAVGEKFGAKSVVVGAGKLVLERGVVITVLRRNSVRRDLIGELEIVLDSAIAVTRRNGRGRRRR